MPYPSPPKPLWAKALAVLVVALAADLMLFGTAPGSAFGLLLLLWCAVVVIAMPPTRRGFSRLLIGIAALFALVMAIDPGFLAWCLYWAALGSAVLLPRHRFDDAARWGCRLVVQALAAVPAPLRDLRSAMGRGGWRLSWSVMILPIVGGTLFLLLFGVANPVIGTMLDRIQPPDVDRLVGHGVMISVALIVAWASLRPRSLRRAPFPQWQAPRIALSSATLASSLAVFNLVFALQNGLDLAFLWSGAPLPAGVTLADYAHQGAYTLIVVALLAAAFVLLFLRPGGAPILRPLVLVWLAQTLLLVASSLLRLADYVAAYMLTGWRIAAFAWMVLVAVGIVLIAWRWIAGRSALWLVNANAMAALAVLALASTVDSGAIAAIWNVRHARTADQIDLAYLRRLGPSALLSLAALERRAGGPVLRGRARALRIAAQIRLESDQRDWRSWTILGAYRSAAIGAATAADRRWYARQAKNAEMR
ncbi:DUF4173 domain-containing protein [Sphingomonas sp.]|uniref:DUF4153 domain-containing protein n=1 Tax=Sphingomonas sp. TaxID=28214 RepID=UPI00258BEFC6|nr:DUF4173 domain-containing protein [Sphingomonas sp.]